MASLGNNVFDQGLDYLTTNGTRIDLTSQEVTTCTEATSTYTLANKTSITVGSAADRSGGGREVTVASVSGGSVTDDGTATHYAITNGSDELLATGDLTDTQVVTNGNTFSLASFTIGIPDPV